LGNILLYNLTAIEHLRKEASGDDDKGEILHQEIRDFHKPIY
jgi:hypothetical protein